MSIVAMRTRERDSARDLAVHRGEQIQRLQAEIAQHLAFRAEVNDALPRPFGVTVIGAIKALRAEVEARPAITEDDIDAIRDGIYGDDRMSRQTLEAALGALERIAHASQLKGDALFSDDEMRDMAHRLKMLVQNGSRACTCAEYAAITALLNPDCPQHGYVPKPKGAAKGDGGGT